MKRLLASIFIFTSLILLPTISMAGAATTYTITITKMELYNGTEYITVFSGSSTAINIAAADSGASAGNFLSGLSVPDGTYTKVRTTVSPSITLSGSDASGGTTYYTTAATASSGGNTGCVSTTTAANEASCAAVVATTPSDTTTFSTPVTMLNGNASHKIRVNFDTSSSLTYSGGALFLDAPTVSVSAIAP